MDVAALRGTLSGIMSGNRVVSYQEARSAVVKGAFAGRHSIRLFYSQNIIIADRNWVGEGNDRSDLWAPEHLWPVSYGLRGTAAATDLHNLVLVDPTVRTARDERFYDELPWTYAECVVCIAPEDTWEPPEHVKGDIARSLFYMDVRYEGADGVPDLSLGENFEMISYRLGHLSTLIDWHCSDPRSQEEVLRHEAAVEAQGNRNAFVDSPELAGDVFGFSCESRN